MNRCCDAAISRIAHEFYYDDEPEVCSISELDIKVRSAYMRTTLEAWLQQYADYLDNGGAPCNLWDFFDRKNLLDLAQDSVLELAQCVAYGMRDDVTDDMNDEMDDWAAGVISQWQDIDLSLINGTGAAKVV